VLNKFILILVTVLLSFSAGAFISDTYTFKDEVTEKRYKSLVKDLRCPKCQNQNLADSNSAIATDLRREVYELLVQGKADVEIVDFMVKRYGEFVLYRPKVSSTTYVLWFGPAFLLLIGTIAVIVIVRRKPIKKAQTGLTAEQKQQLDHLLKDK